MVKSYIDPDGRLHLADGSSFAIARNPERWHAWLELGQPFRLFALHAEGYSYLALTARAKRVQRGGLYCYAYRREANKLYQVYLGKAETITLERLRDAARQLTVY